MLRCGGDWGIRQRHSPELGDGRWWRRGAGGVVSVGDGCSGELLGFEEIERASLILVVEAMVVPWLLVAWWRWEQRGPKHKGNGRDASDRVGALVPHSGESQGPAPQGCQGHSTPSLPDERAPGVVEHRRGAGERPVDEGKKRGEVPSADPAKKLREASFSSTRKARPHLLLLDGVNRDGAESFWDSSDFEIGLRRGAKILFAVRALEAREDKARTDEAKILKELAKLKEDVVRLEASEVKAKEEILRLGGENTSLKEEISQWPEKLGVKEKEGEALRSELSALYERHYTEVQTGAGFLLIKRGNGETRVPSPFLSL
ncbi:uncharacterized protein [Henckelia pumila]|uniref:uncharacterized protein n=1 Tax=Henckelia pumila TaxID=405737 RepID=UPI003C6E8B73